MFVSVLMLESLDEEARLVGPEEKAELLKRKVDAADRAFALLRLSTTKDTSTK